MTETQRLIQFVTENPGTSTSQIREALGMQLKLRSLASVLSRLERAGVMENRSPTPGPGNPASWYILESQASDYSRKVAHEIMTEMAAVHHTVREEFLAEKLDELFEAQ